ncbi:hypothetical protein [Streptomyces shenzhenensis]|uniref:hypothetical protein n=1 Tax=Streptomyces shenzhenensis TaxID=943815 RepID=UPI00340EABEF
MPRNHSRTTAERTYEAPSSVLRRTMLGGIVLAVLLAVAGLLAYLTRPASTAAVAPAPTAPATHESVPPEATSGKAGAVAAPPKTSDPIVFAKAATKALWSYDTRSFSQADQVAGLKRWMTGEKKYADWASVTDQIPSPVLWSRMHDNHQYATVTIGEGHYPQVFKTALTQDPGAITEAYVYAVTVTGKQAIAWKGAGAGAESRSTTLAVQCHPHHHCALVGVLPSVAP